MSKPFKTEVITSFEDTVHQAGSCLLFVREPVRGAWKVILVQLMISNSFKKKKREIILRAQQNRISMLFLF